MPVKFRVKKYISGGIYYIYNRSRDKEGIFRENEDFEKFKQLLIMYLQNFQPIEVAGYKNEKPYVTRHKQAMSLEGEVELWAYSLGRQGYRLLVKQHTEKGITRLMRRMITNYVMYFNQKYNLRGSPFENVYRAVSVEQVNQALWLSVYIHSPLVHRSVQRFGIVETVSENTDEYINYSSYNNYLYNLDEKWISTEVLKNEFDREFRPIWSNYSDMVKFKKHDWKTLLGEIPNL